MTHPQCQAAGVHNHLKTRPKARLDRRKITAACKAISMRFTRWFEHSADKPEWIEEIGMVPNYRRQIVARVLARARWCTRQRSAQAAARKLLKNIPTGQHVRLPRTPAD